MPHWPMTLAIVALPAAAATAAPLKSHDVRATFVSADANAGTFTMALDDGSRSSAVAEAGALRALWRLKTGDRIRVTCRDEHDGEQVAAMAITIVK